MAGEKQENPWPVPKFYFLVRIGDLGEITFQEVSGLDTEHDIKEYRTGDNNNIAEFSMPGLRKASDVTLKKGMFKDNGLLFDYFMAVKMNTIKREKVTIQLLDEAGKPVFVWELSNAWPLKMTGTDLNAESSEVAFETLVLAHEGLEIKQV